MERRRFVPSPEGLEGRSLLSLFGGTHSRALSNPAQDVPATFAQKQLRVEHLPFYLEQFEPGRFLPKSVITQLQTDLFAITTQLHRPSPAALVGFNTIMRDITPKVSLTAQDALTLNHSFQVILNNAGATADQTANIQRDMNQLAVVDAQSPQPVFLATNDYATVLQTILGVGRPIVRPTQPLLAAKDGVRTQPGYAISKNHTPSLVGTYGVGATVGPFAGDLNGGFRSYGDIIQILNSQGVVIGDGPVAKNGNYRAMVTQPLPDGVYTLYVRAVDTTGHMSKPSPMYKLKIVSHGERAVAVGNVTPQGPLGL